MGFGKFGSGDPTKTQHQISSSNTGDNHIAGNLVIEGNLSVSGSTSFASGGGARSVSGDTDNGIITWKTSDDTFIVESGVLVTGDGHLSSSGKGYFEKDVEIADNLLVSGSVTAGGGISIPDDQTLTFGTDSNVTVEYDEDGNDVLLFNNGVRFQKDQNGVTSVLCKNDHAGTSANARFQVQANGGAGMTMAAYDDGHSDAEFADKGLIFTDTGSTALAIMSRATAGTIEMYTGGNAAANKRVVITSDGHLSASQKLYVEKDVEIADNLLVSGSGTFKGSGVTIEASGGDCILTLKDTDGNAEGNRTYIKGVGLDGNTDWILGDSGGGAGDLNIYNSVASGIIEVETKSSDGGNIVFKPRGTTAVEITTSGHLSSSGKGYFEKDVEIAESLLVSGSATLGSAASSVTTVTGRLSASEGMFIPDDKKLWFGTTDTAYIEKDEDSAFDDLKVWTGANGMRLASSTSTQPKLTLMNINSDANGPVLQLYKYAAGSAANNDIVGTIEFKSLDSSDNGTIYADIRSNIQDKDHTEEEGSLTFNVLHSGESNSLLVLNSNTITMGTGSANVELKGRLSQSDGAGTSVFMSDVIVGSRGNTYHNLYVSGGLTAGTIDCYQVSQSYDGFGATNVFNNSVVLGKINGGANADLYVSGNVGIGMTPVKPLDITAAVAGFPVQIINDGDATARKGIKIQCGADTIGGGDTNVYVLCNDGNGDASGQLQDSGGTFSAADTSDRRLKQNIVDTELAGLDVINSMQVRDFEWKKSGIKTTGFIAQEMKEAFAMAASGDESGDPAEDPMMIMRDVIVVPLVKAVQELSAKVKELEDQLKNQ